MNTVLPAPDRPVTPSRMVGLNRLAPNSPSALAVRRISSVISVRVGTGLHIRAMTPLHQLVGRGFQRARNHEAIEPSAAAVQLGPVIDREVDHREAGGREFLEQAL